MLIGLTGGIATGKSTVSSMLRNLGAVVVDADQVSRDVVAPGTEGLAALAESFGAEILNADGSLNRVHLGSIVFSDQAKRHQLEGIVHPLIAQESMRQINAAMSGGAKWVVYDAALLIESGRKELFRPLIVVTTDHDTQCARLMERDALTLEDALARIRSQMPLEEKASHADFVIDNSGPLDATERQLNEILRKLEGSN